LLDSNTNLYFIGKRWQSYIVNKRGRYCDVLSIKNNTIAIIEVKSPAEVSCQRNYDDTKNLSRSLINILPQGFSTRRNTIMSDNINNYNGITLIKLYVVSISCQLYRYFIEFNEKFDKYRDAIGRNNLSNRNTYQCKPFLVVPIEAERQVQVALEYSKDKNYISDFSVDNNDKLFVAEIIY
jgi:hypothetical protein